MGGNEKASVRLTLRALASALLATTCLAGAAHANPTGGVVAAGSATIASSGSKMVIDTQTQRTIINWSSFSIGRSESVVVNQPNSTSMLLDRVNAGGGISYILGNWSSNGRIILVNPAGVVIGSESHITAAQAVLSTIGISDANFLGGNFVFDQSGAQGAAVWNRGTVTATGGAAILAGETVKNDGVVTAALGTVVLAGAKTYTVDFTGDGLLKFAVTTPVDQVSPQAQALVENTGKLSAAGGVVLLTAQAAKGVIDNVINTSGIVEATSVAAVNGKIVLEGTGGGTVVAGTLDASGKGAGETGGSVSVLGDSVTLTASAKIDVSGDRGGGSVTVESVADGVTLSGTATTLSEGSLILANAFASGNGGNVTVTSDGTTNFQGSIAATGAEGGMGGNVVTSGAMLNFAGGKVSTGSAGHSGTWLIDPYDLTIDAAGAATLASALAGSNVTVETGLSGASGFGAVNAGGNGDITVAAPIAWSSGNALTLSAYRDIDVDAAITSRGGGNITLQADNTHTGTGIVSFNGGSIATAGAVAILEPPPGYDILHYAPSIASSSLLVSYVDDDISTFTGTGSSGRATFMGTDLLTWGQFGSAFTNVPDGSTATSSGGTQVVIAGSVRGEMQRRDEGDGWTGDFVSGDQLIFYQTSGALVLGFPTGVNSIGTEVEANTGGGPPFTALVTIYNGGTQLAALMENGHSGACGSCNQAPFFGFVDNTGPNITEMTVQTTGFADGAGFSINQLSLGGAGSGGGTKTTTTTTNTVLQVTPPPITVTPPVVVPVPPVVAVQTVAPPPPPPQPVVAPLGGQGVTSVGDIDTGGQAFSQIVGGGGGSSDPVTQVQPIAAVSHSQPTPQATAEAVGGLGNLFQAKQFFVPPKGVPGVDEPASTSGNRSLWFAGGGAA